MAARPEGFPATIAIDGPAASGKSTVGQELARQLGYGFLDTGLLYRAFTLAALRRGIPAADDEACRELAGTLDLRFETGPPPRVLLGRQDVTALLHQPDIDQAVSGYSGIPAVRAALILVQREIAGRGRMVLAGRDIGSVVLPDAPVKLFLTASEDERARRRRLEAGGEQREISARDSKDHRTTPLEPAPGATTIDTTGLAPAEVVALALDAVRCAAS